MGFLEIINRKKRNIALTIFIVACILCVTTGTGNSMSRKKCKKLRTEIRTLRVALDAAIEAGADLVERYRQTTDGRLIDQLGRMGIESQKQRRNLETKEATWDSECRGKLFLQEP